MIKILLPTDFSKASINAIEYALNFASGSNAKFIFYHSFIPFNSALSGTPEYNRKEIIKVEQELKIRIEKLKFKMNEKFPDVAIEICIDKGAETRQIISYSKKNKIDLIIMGTTGASGLKEIIIGSVTADIIAKSECPVLAVPSNYKYKPIQKMLMPTNYALHDLIALKFLFQFSVTKNAAIHFLHISPKGKPSVKDTELMEAFKKTINSSLKKRNKEFSLHQGNDAERCISNLVKKEKIDLTVVTTIKRKSFIDRFFHSSLTKKMACHTRIPLLALPVNEI
ncbi:MAG: universal stress protein [bacterium]|nr:universal stress protein [bacterium]